MRLVGQLVSNHQHGRRGARLADAGAVKRIQDFHVSGTLQVTKGGWVYGPAKGS